MLKLIIFDWDDVFTRGSTSGYIRCYHEALAAVGFALDPEEERRRVLLNWGKPARAELEGLLYERPDLVSAALTAYEHSIFGGSFVDCLALVPGSVELVQRLSTRYTLCIATGINPRLLREQVMPRFGIPDLFTQIVSVYDVMDASQAKPSPFMAQLILTTQHVAAQEALLVGDASGDVLMARAAGITPVAVLTGHLSREQAQALDVSYIIDDVTQLDDVLAMLDPH